MLITEGKNVENHLYPQHGKLYFSKSLKKISKGFQDLWIKNFIHKYKKMV
jgi:hypothetical protein